MLVENGVGDLDCPRGDHPHFPSPVVLERRSQHETFFAMLCEFPLALRLVVYERFHADGDKGFGAVVVLPLDVGIGLYLGVHIGVAEQEELPFSLWDNLAPQVERES